MSGCVVEVIIGFGALYIVVLVTWMVSIRHLCKSADKRLDRANEMVLTLAHSADTLAKSMIEMKDLTESMKRTYEMQISEMTQNRDAFKESYQKLLTRYQYLEDKIINDCDKMRIASFEAVQELAKRPNQPYISNKNVE